MMISSAHKLLLAVVAVGLLAAGVVIGFKKATPSNDPDHPTACTQEAKLCPDGSYVGRTGPKCEFAPCPNPGPTNTSTGISGKVLLGPTCPVVKDPPEEECADKPFATSLVVTTADGARVIAQVSSDARGVFTVNVPPGDYAIRSAAVANVLPYCGSSETISVPAQGFVETTVHCDTGIR